MSIETKKDKLRKDGALHPNPQKIKDDRFTPDSFFNSNDLVQVKYEMLRSVSEERLPASKAAEKYGLSRPSYYQAREQFDSEGLVGLIPQKRGPKNARKLTDEVVEFIERQINDSDVKLLWEELAGIIKAKFETVVHPRSIERAMKNRKTLRSKKKNPE